MSLRNQIYLLFFAILSPTYCADFLDSNQQKIILVEPTHTDILGNRHSIPYGRALEIVSAPSKWSNFAEWQFLSTDTARQIYDKIGFRDSEGDRVCVDHLCDQQRTNPNIFTNDTAVFMDSGGPHSIAMATVLMRQGKYQPVWKFTEPLTPKNYNSLAQNIAVLKYFAPEFDGTHNPDSPPVFIMDQHSSLETTDRPFPTSQDLLARGIKSVIWITEGSTNDKPAEMTPIQGLDSYPKYSALEDYIRSNIKVYRYKIDPHIYKRGEKGYKYKDNTKNFDDKSISDTMSKLFTKSACDDQEIIILDDGSITFTKYNLNCSLLPHGYLCILDQTGMEVKGQQVASMVFEFLHNQAQSNPQLKAALGMIKPTNINN